VTFVLDFPIELELMNSDLRARITVLNAELMEDLKRKSSRSRIQYKHTGWVEFDKFYPKNSKPIIDEIVGAAFPMENRVLAQHLKSHWGFTAAELDDLINYDIKYRMGRDSGRMADGYTAT